MAINDGDKKLFDYVLARSRTRESSTLTIATVASSASLVLLALYIQAYIETCDSCQYIFLLPHSFWIIYFGMVFPTVGILYREVTKHSIHDNDNRWLAQFISKYRTEDNRDFVDNNHKIITDPLCYCDYSKTREGILRSLLYLPIIAWSLVIDTVTNGLTIPLALIIQIIILILGALYIGFLSWRDRKD